MDAEVLKTLWNLRFSKLRKGEEEAAWGYQELLDFCLDQYDKDDEVVTILRTLVKEERVHEKIAEKLISICRKSHPELPLM